MSSEKNFSVWLFRPRPVWARADGKGAQVGQGFGEPAEAADYAEGILTARGEAGKSYCELRFNGDPKPHTVICFMGENHYGIWNTEAVKWPIFYPEIGGNDMLADFPFEIEDDGNSWQEKEDADSKEKSDEGAMRLDAIEDVDDSDDEIQEEDDADEEVAEEDEDAEEDAAGSDEDDSDDDDEDSDGDDDSDFTEDEDGDEEDEDQDEDGSDVDDSENDEEEEEEIEMPRLNIFAKFRGPLGWRKRAEAEELQESNRFALKLGVLDTEAEKTKDQEAETFFEMLFIESDANHNAGELRLKLPAGIEFSEPTKAGWISASIPYRQADEDA